MTIGLYEIRIRVGVNEAGDDTIAFEAIDANGSPMFSDDHLNICPPVPAYPNSLPQQIGECVRKFAVRIEDAILPNLKGDANQDGRTDFGDVDTVLEDASKENPRISRKPIPYVAPTEPTGV